MKSLREDDNGDKLIGYISEYDIYLALSIALSNRVCSCFVHRERITIPMIYLQLIRDH